MKTWNDLIGKRVRVFLSERCSYAVDVTVKSYKDGFVTFDDSPAQYDVNDIIFVKELFLCWMSNPENEPE
jgi:hypothetical protein